MVRLGLGVAQTGAIVTARALGAASEGPVPTDPRRPLRRSRLGRERALLRPASVLPALRTGDEGARGDRRRRGAGGQGRVRGRAARRRARADELPPGNPTALKRAFETGGTSLVRGASRFVDDAVPTAAGRGRWTRARSCSAGPRGDPGEGRLPEQADGADPVRAAHGEGLRDPDPAQPALDQQVLHHGSGAGEELRRVGARPRPHSLLHQLPQPGRVVPGRGLRGLPARGGST